MRLSHIIPLGPTLLPAVLLTCIAYGQNLPAHDPTAQDSTTTDTQSSTQSLTPEQIALIERYLTNVHAQPVGKIDTKTAAAGQSISLETTQEATLANGTQLPRGTHLVGRILRAQAWQLNGAAAILSIQIDRAMLKDGTSIPIRCVFRTFTTMAVPPSGLIDASQGVSRPRRGGGGLSAGGPPGGTVPLGAPTPMGDGPMGTASGADVGGNSPLGGVGSPGSSGSAGTRGTVGGGMPAGDPGVGGTGTRPPLPNTTAIPATTSPELPVALAGESVHDVPRRTGLAGVMLSGTSIGDTTGILSAFERNIALDSGTQITLGVITR